MLGDPKRAPILENYPYSTLIETLKEKTLIETLMDPFKEP